jgi:radical SAM protein with 4Fe4S-binding SPASM domain
MSAEVFETIFKNIDATSIDLLRLFNFGEPLINKELPRILELIRDSGKQISAVEISTNAQHHDFETLEQAIKARVLTHFNISCDGDGTPNDYERLRPPSKWSKLILFLEKISEFRSRHHPNLVLTTRTICSDPNQQTTWTDILRPYGITPIFRPWHYLPGSTNMTGRDVKPKANVCSFLKTPSRLYIDFDGTVVPCCVHPKAGELGNLINTKFSKLVSDDQYRDFILLMDTNREKMMICNECEF